MMSNISNSCGPTSTLEALLQQEERSYLTRSTCNKDDDNNNNNNNMMLSDGDRQKLADWMERVRCHFYWSPSTIEVGLNLLDRYLLLPTTSTCGTTQQHQQQQQQPNFYYMSDNDVLLACVTCMYIAGKTCEYTVAAPRIFWEASRGLFSIQEIEMMEQHILHSLGWLINPPTSFDFVQEIVQQIVLLQNNDDDDNDVNNKSSSSSSLVEVEVVDLEMVKESANLMCELCVGHDPVLRGIPKSLIAIAAVSKALSIHQKQQLLQDNSYNNKNLNFDYNNNDLVVNRIPALQERFSSSSSSSSCESSTNTSLLKTIQEWLHWALVQQGYYQFDDDEEQQQRDEESVPNPLNDDDDDVSCNGNKKKTKKKTLPVHPPPSPRTVIIAATTPATTLPSEEDEEEEEIHNEDDPSIIGIKRKISFDDEERDDDEEEEEDDDEEEEEEEEEEVDTSDSKRLPFERRVRTKLSNSSNDKEGFDYYAF